MPIKNERSPLPLCPVCQTPSSGRVARKKNWSYFRCPSCPLVFLHPQPPLFELIASYQEYLPDSPRQIQAWLLAQEEVIRKSADLIEARITPGRILDVGSGYGFFLQHMARRGWQAEGIEISNTGRTYCLTQFPGLEIRSTPLPDPLIPEETYDAVTLFYVIEHLPDPLRLIREAFRLLKPGGVLLLRWPNTTPIVRLLGPLARLLDLYHTPYHLFDYSKPFIEKSLSTIGFYDIKTVICGNTKPASRLDRFSSFLFGGLGEWLCRTSQSRWLLPGVSKTTIARKRRE